jgi:hypothetical protein
MYRFGYHPMAFGSIYIVHMGIAINQRRLSVELK